MAGHITTHRASHAILARKFSGRQLVEASVELMGRTFRTLIHEGASAEDLIEKVARENGGGVAKVYYPEFKTWEIVAVKIGDQVLVKDSPERVAEADFSQFPDPGFRSMAIRAAANSDGGIHFSIGRNGIPLAIMDNEEIVFPNAEELRIGKNTRSISLWMTSANVNPVSLADLSQSYSSTGGLQVSRDALRKIEESHGGCRSDKLLLEDNILVLNKDTGELSTLSQPAAVPRNMPIPSPDFLPAVSMRSDILVADQQIRNLDGNQSRNPCLLVRTFDGLAADQFRIRMDPPPGLATAADSPPQAIRAPAMLPGPPRLDNPRLAFSLLRFDIRDAPSGPLPEDFPPKGSSQSAVRIKPAPADNAQGAGMKDGAALPSALTPEIILQKFTRPRRAKVRLGVPSSVSVLAPQAVPAARKKRKRKRPEYGNALLKLERRKKPASDDPRGAPRKGPSAALKVRPGKKRLRPAAARRPSRSEGVAPPGKKSAKPKPPAANVRSRLSAAQTRKARNPGPTAAKPRKIPKAVLHERRKAPVPGALPPREVSRKRQLHPYFLREMLGLYWKKRGRKLRTKKKSAV